MTKERQGESIVSVYIEDEMKDSYLNYAMSVIIGRALPDVRDGLKPVHRRILYAMNEMGLSSDKPYRKSARVVGEVLGKYHPHGDAAVYDAMVRMAQDFTLRYPLLDGQGNFGSVDGDSPAAMRYTEIRLAPISLELLSDIKADTVNFVPNFDGTIEEPIVLPAALPNLLVNGSSGIAVGMATNIPPHNLSEVVDSILRLIEEPDIDVDGLMESILGPDFPTGGIILGRKGIREAYLNGRGRIVLRACIEIEKGRSGRTSIIIKELPYQVNKSELLKKIAELVQEKKISGIINLRDESDRDGMRIVLELKREAEPSVILNQLYKYTQLQTTFVVIILALVDGSPRILSLKELLTHYIEYRKEIVRRRTRYQLRLLESRAHILEGLKQAILNLDGVISLIRASVTPTEAKDGLMKSFNLSEPQAQAILDTTLARLTKLEHEKIESEYLEVIKEIASLRSILASEERILAIIKEELSLLKRRYGDERRTQILDEAINLEEEDLIKEEDVVITISHAGYIKRLPIATYHQQRRGGRGMLGVGMKEEDFVEHLFIGSTHSSVLFFTNHGRVHVLKVHQIPETTRLAKGKAIVNLLRLRSEETVTAVISVDRFNINTYLLMATKKGLVKKSLLSLYSNIRSCGITALSLNEGDELIDVALTSGEDEVIVATSSGKALRFHERDVRPMGRAAAGVMGIRLIKDDVVIGMTVIRRGLSLLTVTEKGYGKQTAIESYPLHKRGCQGVIDIKTSGRNGKVVAIKAVSKEDEVILITEGGIVIRIPVKEISVRNRKTQGIRLIRLDKDDRLVGCALVANNKGVVQSYEEEKEVLC